MELQKSIQFGKDEKKNEDIISDTKRKSCSFRHIALWSPSHFFQIGIFTNFLIKNKVVINENYRTIQFKKDNTGVLKRLIQILFGIDKNVNFSSNAEFDSFTFNKETFNDKLFLTIPFKFKITHKDNDYRELTVIHPINQLYLVGFYDKYKNTISL